MKFKIRFAEQIVGLLIILALASIAFVIVMLGSTHRWFIRDSVFYTELSSAAGISINMPVLYRGFTIGNVKDFGLNEYDFVVVTFSIYAEYRDRVKEGSIVELVASPIGLGNQFLFHPGKGEEEVPDNGFLPDIDTLTAKMYMRQGLVDEPERDNIAQILAGANHMVNILADALETGTDATTLGQIIGGINRTIAGVETLPETVNNTVENLAIDIDILMASLNEILAGVDPIIDDLNVLTTMLADPDGIIPSILDPEGEVYVSLVESLQSVSGILGSLDETVAYVPRQMPQLVGLIIDLQLTLQNVNDVLVALTNNPLLKGGVPGRVDVQYTGTNPRNIQF